MGKTRRTWNDFFQKNLFRKLPERTTSSVTSRRSCSGNFPEEPLPEELIPDVSLEEVVLPEVGIFF